MLENITVIGREYDYGYDTYYVARKDESIGFPSNSAIVDSLNPQASKFTVKNTKMPVTMNVKGTLKSYSYTDAGWLSKVAKHFVASGEIISGTEGDNTNEFVYELNNYPLVTGSLKGRIYNDDIAVQTFEVNLGTTELTFTNVGNPLVKVTYGTYENDNVDKISKIILNWNGAPDNNSFIAIDYEYESPETYSVVTSGEPIFDDYNFVNLYGSTSIDAKLVEIASTFKCLYKMNNGSPSYTNTSSKVFYTRCKKGQSLCSSKSSAYVPAMTVCNEKLF